MAVAIPQSPNPESQPRIRNLGFATSDSQPRIRNLGFATRSPHASRRPPPVNAPAEAAPPPAVGGQVADDRVAATEVDGPDRRPCAALPLADGLQSVAHQSYRGLECPADRTVAAEVSPHDAGQRLHTCRCCQPPGPGQGGNGPARPHDRGGGDQHQGEGPLPETAGPQPGHPPAHRTGEGQALPHRHVTERAPGATQGRLAAARAAAEQGGAAGRGNASADPADHAAPEAAVGDRRPAG